MYDWMTKSGYCNRIESPKKFEDIIQIKVHQQQWGSMLCGFHCLWNAKCFLWAVLAKSSQERALNLRNLQSGSKFHSSHLSTMRTIEKCTNLFYVNQTDKKQLRKLQNPLERNMLRYLLLNEPEIKSIKTNDSKIKVYFHIISEQFTLMQFYLEELVRIKEDLESFQAANRESVFVVFLGLLNHWVTVIAHKEPVGNGNKFETRLYLFDSMNTNFYFQPDDCIQHLFHN